MPGPRCFGCNAPGRRDRGIGGFQTYNGQTQGDGAERSPLVYARVRAASYEGILVAGNTGGRKGLVSFSDEDENRDDPAWLSI